MKTNIKEVLSTLPTTNKAAIILSGGLDSTIAMRILVEKYGAENVHAISFDYGQKQRVELQRAAESTKLLGVTHQILKLDALNQIAQGYSANVDKNIAMPTIEDVLGNPSSPTEVPNRNMVMLSIAAAYCQTRKIETLVCGIQANDTLQYWDTSNAFVEAINAVLTLNRMTKVRVSAPFADFSKTVELQLLEELDGHLRLLIHTLTCYNPDEENRSCGTCPACSERLKAFQDVNQTDLIPYV